eukprot:CAMPEP_0118852292 /NCGR_PEP_ID=MMETSP1163-20130328/1253_1 /TAXON_ID=124430 /ORGANISM="Phaeomonas parva, Strain CCMP2877" /LENGTH=248 /DNA_ID=CAMNT_0006784701 /DNA_START=271 /DNA_END=1017 /DNA_ORIENTATION=-
MEAAASDQSWLWLVWAAACVLGTVWANVLFGHPTKWRPELAPDPNPNPNPNPRSNPKPNHNPNRNPKPNPNEPNHGPHRIDVLAALPEELQHNVLRYLPADSVAAVASVSRAWRWAADARVWVDVSEIAMSGAVARVEAFAAGAGAALVAALPHNPNPKQQGLLAFSGWWKRLVRKALLVLLDHRRCALLIGGSVYDLTEFMHDHPGGAGILRDAEGTDATSFFDLAGHSAAALRAAAPFRVVGYGEF